jgi:hypothetical protein
MALFLDTAGGAWDNAKKYIELGNYGGGRTRELTRQPLPVIRLEIHSRIRQVLRCTWSEVFVHHYSGGGSTVLLPRVAALVSITLASSSSLE